jgi:hypothetical protein
LVIDEGVVFEGHCRMSQGESAAAAEEEEDMKLSAVT